MNISYIDMWPGFNPGSNWFNKVFLNLLNGKEINFHSSPQEADIIISSIFGKEKEKHQNLKAVKIFYTGENVQPNLVDCDYSLSFDFNFKNGRNFRLPHWYLYIDWWGGTTEEISLEQLLHQWNPEEVLSRPKFCSIVIGNPVKNRIEVAYKLLEYKGVHGYGSAFGNPYNGSKLELLENFKFNICFENTISQGYVTEKLLQAKVAGCVPLYYGDDSAGLDFNKKSFINYADFSNLSEFYEFIKKIDTDKDRFIKIASQPLFEKIPNLDGLYEFLRKILRLRGIV